LQLNNFPQAGITGQSLTLTGTATLDITSSTFNGAVSFTAPDIGSINSTFMSSADFVKTGTGGYGLWNGGNTFNGITSFTYTNNTIWRLQQTSTDVFNNQVTINNNDNTIGRIALAYGAPVTFKGNVIFNQPNGGTSTAITIGET